MVLSHVNLEFSAARRALSSCGERFDKIYSTKMYKLAKTTISPYHCVDCSAYNITHVMTSLRHYVVRFRLLNCVLFNGNFVLQDFFSIHFHCKFGRPLGLLTRAKFASHDWLSDSHYRQVIKKLLENNGPYVKSGKTYCVAFCGLNTDVSCNGLQRLERAADCRSVDLFTLGQA